MWRKTSCPVQCVCVCVCVCVWVGVCDCSGSVMCGRLMIDVKSGSHAHFSTLESEFRHVRMGYSYFLTAVPDTL